MSNSFKFGIVISNNHQEAVMFILERDCFYMFLFLMLCSRYGSCPEPPSTRQPHRLIGTFPTFGVPACKTLCSGCFSSSGSSIHGRGIGWGCKDDDVCPQGRKTILCPGLQVCLPAYKLFPFLMARGFVQRSATPPLCLLIQDHIPCNSSCDMTG